MSVEEISKIWSALQSQYRPTAVYKASVVLIESKKSVRPTLPVQARNLAVLPFEHPVIDLIQSQENDGAPIVENQPILAGYNLVIDGQRLRGDATRVLIDEEEIVPDDDRVTAERIIVALPGTLQPGLHSVQVAHRVDFGTGFPSEPHRGFESNVAAFVLAPRITTPSPVNAAPNSILSLGIAPPIGPAQRATLLVGATTVSIAARPPNDPPASSLDFPIPGACGGRLSPPSADRRRGKPARDRRLGRLRRTHSPHHLMSAGTTTEDWSSGQPAGSDGGAERVAAGCCGASLTNPRRRRAEAGSSSAGCALRNVPAFRIRAPGGFVLRRNGIGR